MFGSAILNASQEYGVNPRLLASIIEVESKGYPFSFRPEPEFHVKYIKGKSEERLGGYFPATMKAGEMTLRACSIGLMQIMGQTARENSFDGESLLELVNPKVNISLGAKILKRFLDEEEGDVRKALLRWNGGGDKEYPNRVIKAMEEGEALKYLAS